MFRRRVTLHLPHRSLELLTAIDRCSTRVPVSISASSAKAHPAIRSKFLIATLKSTCFVASHSDHFVMRISNLETACHQPDKSAAVKSRRWH